MLKTLVSPTMSKINSLNEKVKEHIDFSSLREICKAQKFNDFNYI